MSEYQVIVGHFNRDLMTEEHKYSPQTMNIFHIEFPVQYLGKDNNYYGDIAILTLKEAIIYRNNIGPACLNFNASTVNEKLLPPDDTIGLVAGFGMHRGSPNNHLRKINYPIVNFEKCRVLADDSTIRFLVDEFCAGYVDSEVFCRGDSGAGFVIKNKETNTYFVHGIFSNTQALEDTSGCDEYFYSFFTNVMNYIDLIAIQYEKSVIRLREITHAQIKV